MMGENWGPIIGDANEMLEAADNLFTVLESITCRIEEAEKGGKPVNVGEPGKEGRSATDRYYNAKFACSNQE
jgi:hypothetical protein